MFLFNKKSTPFWVDLLHFTYTIPFYKAIDQALHKIEEQLRKIKGKREDRHNKNQPLGKFYATSIEEEEDQE